MPIGPGISDSVIVVFFLFVSVCSVCATCLASPLTYPELISFGSHWHFVMFFAGVSCNGNRGFLPLLLVVVLLLFRFGAANRNGSAVQSRVRFGTFYEVR